MLKILYLDHAPIFGGAEKALVDLIRSLDDRQYRPVVVTAPGSAFLTQLTTDGIRTVSMPFEQINVRHPALVLRVVRSALALAGIIRSEKPDVLHSNTVRAHAVSALAALLTGVPLVWTMHDRTLPIPLFRLLRRVPRRIIFVSQFLAGLYRSEGLDPRRCQVIVNGVKTAPATVDAAVARQKLGLAPDRPVILNVGRLIIGKGQDVFLQAAALVVQRRPDAVFLIVGGPNEGDSASARYVERLGELTRSLNLERNVIFTSQQRDVAGYYEAADLCAYTAIVPEGFGLVILEAMAFGRAVVASNLGAVPELVLDGITGKLVRPGDARDLAESINSILDDREALKQLGAAGRQRVVEHFDPDRSFALIRRIYEEVVAQARGA